eukprot:jgi/Mesen1/4942/ME000247S04238
MDSCFSANMDFSPVRSAEVGEDSRRVRGAAASAVRPLEWRTFPKKSLEPILQAAIRDEQGSVEEKRVRACRGVCRTWSRVITCSHKRVRLAGSNADVASALDELRVYRSVTHVRLGGSFSRSDGPSPFVFFDGELLRGLTEGFPLLTSLHVELCREGGSLPDLAHFFSHRTSLRALQLTLADSVPSSGRWEYPRRMLPSLAALQPLRELHLRLDFPSEVGAAELGAVASLRALTSLTLQYENCSGSEAARESLARAVFNPRLRKLRLRCDWLPPLRAPLPLLEDLQLHVGVEHEGGPLPQARLDDLRESRRHRQYGLFAFTPALRSLDLALTNTPLWPKLGSHLSGLTSLTLFHMAESGAVCDIGCMPALKVLNVDCCMVLASLQGLLALSPATAVSLTCYCSYLGVRRFRSFAEYFAAGLPCSRMPFDMKRQLFHDAPRHRRPRPRPAEPPPSIQSVLQMLVRQAMPGWLEFAASINARTSAALPATAGSHFRAPDALLGSAPLGVLDAAASSVNVDGAAAPLVCSSRRSSRSAGAWPDRGGEEAGPGCSGGCTLRTPHEEEEEEEDEGGQGRSIVAEDDSSSGRDSDKDDDDTDPGDGSLGAEGDMEKAEVEEEKEGAEAPPSGRSSEQLLDCKLTKTAKATEQQPQQHRREAEEPEGEEEEGSAADWDAYYLRLAELAPPGRGGRRSYMRFVGLIPSMRRYFLTMACVQPRAARAMRQIRRWVSVPAGRPPSLAVVGPARAGGALLAGRRALTGLKARAGAGAGVGVGVEAEEDEEGLLRGTVNHVGDVAGASGAFDNDEADPAEELKVYGPRLTNGVACIAGHSESSSSSCESEDIEATGGSATGDSDSDETGGRGTPRRTAISDGLNAGVTGGKLPQKDAGVTTPQAGLPNGKPVGPSKVTAGLAAAARGASNAPPSVEPGRFREGLLPRWRSKEPWVLLGVAYTECQKRNAPYTSWDAELDRGRQKIVRQRVPLGERESNPFQVNPGDTGGVKREKTKPKRGAGKERRESGRGGGGDRGRGRGGGGGGGVAAPVGAHEGAHVYLYVSSGSTLFKFWVFSGTVIDFARQGKGIKPNLLTYRVLLSAYGRAGQLAAMEDRCVSAKSGVSSWTR